MDSLILIAEKDHSVAINLMDILAAFGLKKANVTISGEGLLSLASEAEPTLIISEVELKGSISSFDALRQIRKMYDVPVIYISEHEDNLIDAMENFIYCNVLIKPFTTRELKESILELCPELFSIITLNSIFNNKTFND
jgi:DNA-binding response OmpR family regulator